MPPEIAPVVPGEVRAGFDPRRLHHWIAFGFGSGLAPWAPGTFGTLAALPLYLILAPLPLGAYLAVLAVLILVGVWACDRTARDLGSADPGAIVWDEFAGLLVTLTAAPPGWVWVLAGFLLFRGFDILKPWPINWLERRVSGGLGIMVDDLAAGLAAWACLHLIHRVAA
ncbi:phosphatidylglycerophosphatase A family protein [Lamprocystis purpurea]|jgi:phosphatidylglycerophosphatase A|uniref:phosphatidylglycerophosphatase A family protein n=1 Tax=Lamprocystis purpurea TaxID=61598 RepID=UPI0006869D89|nr:phosphatidylglycerophosphatase A [Lamprocystis purpurea]